MSIVPNPNADFSPAGGVYTELKPFRFWCQKVLPLVYDDSLSYYELLCKVVDYLNKTMEDVDNAVTEVQALHAAYDLLEAYVNDYFSTLDVQQEINNKLDAMAQSGALSALISPFVEEWLPGVVEDQIPGVVGEQIGGTVAQQIGATVGAQIGATVAGQISPVVADWLDKNITPTTPAVDASLSIAGAAADAKATGDVVADLKSQINQLPTHREWISPNIRDGKRWNFYDSFNLIDAGGYYACSFDADENQQYTIYARNIGTNTTFAIAFFSGTTLISSVSNAPSTDDHSATFTTPSGCNSVRFTTNNNNKPYIRVFRIALGRIDAVYVSLNGPDNASGEQSHPFSSIQKAINSNYSDTIIIASGRYQEQLAVSNRDVLHLIGDISGGTYIDFTKTITTELDAETRLRKGTYQSTANDVIYKVFVSKELPIADTSGNATAYTVNLWSFSGAYFMIPKATLEEVKNTPDSWTYDGSNIYVNSAASAYKLIAENTSVCASFTNVQDLWLDHISFKYAGYNNVYIDNCKNAKISLCEFISAGTQHGLALNNTNADVIKCLARYNCFDGFNIHNKGNSIFTDCTSVDNRDDGMSHHDGSTGTVIGGYYARNYKGGISPTYDAKVDIYNAVCESNSYGIYYAASSAEQDCIISGCALLNNSGYGLRVNGMYKIRSVGSMYSGNATAPSKADNGGSITEIAPHGL